MPVEQTIDPDIFEIFEEEVEEVLAELKESAAEYFPITEIKSETYKSLRRGFHTMKGSGRMAGATVIGELAWAFEDMLNQLGDGKIKPDPRMEQAVLDCIEIFPVMMTDLREKRYHSDDYLKLIGRAQAIIKGEEEIVATTTTPVTQTISEADEDMALNAEISAKITELYDKSVADNAAIHSLAHNVGALEKLIHSLQDNLSRHATAIEFTDNVNKKHDVAIQEISQYLMRHEEMHAATGSAGHDSASYSGAQGGSYAEAANEHLSEEILELKHQLLNATAQIERLESRSSSAGSASASQNPMAKWMPVAIVIVWLIAIAGLFI
jgi:chemotaxis protein histidine kinase CheA